MFIRFLVHIKELLQSATPGRWGLWPKESSDKYSIAADNDHHKDVMWANTQEALSFSSHTNCELIVNSKDYIQQLADEVERLQKIESVAKVIFLFSDKIMQDSDTGDFRCPLCGRESEDGFNHLVHVDVCPWTYLEDSLKPIS